MNTQEQADELVIPPPDVLAFFVRFQRGMMRWKQAALAAQAGVSLSTVQRVERGESVSKEKLDKIGCALGHPTGAFTEPRARASDEEALQRVVESFAWLTDTVPVAVSPLRKEPQLRDVLGCASAFVDSDLGPDADEDLAVLLEWMDFASWMVATSEGLVTPRPGRSFKKRELYADIFRHVRDMERKYRAVCLIGSYDATSNVELFKTLRVGVVSFKSKDKNPAAATIPELRAPPHLDLQKKLRQWLEGHD
jgi:transcriptional regulator with XRE-family HTH domain